MTSHDGDSGPGVELDLVLFDVVIRCRDGRVRRRLVIRRTVYTWTRLGEEVGVEETWSSSEHVLRRSIVEVMRGLASVAVPLLSARPVQAMPSMARVTHPSLDALEPQGERRDVALVAHLHLKLGATTAGGIGEAELTCAPGLLGRVARHTIDAALAAIGLTGTGQPEDVDPDDDLSLAEPGGANTQTAAALLDQDGADARSRLDSEDRWNSAVRATLTPVADLETGEPETAAAWQHWARPSCELASPEPDEITVVLVGAVGVSVGHDNAQYNLFRYRIEPTVDLDAVFGDPFVRKALDRFRASPNDASAREEAVLAIMNCRPGGDVTDWGSFPSRDPVVCRDDTGGVLAGTVLICDCRDVQVGNHNRQYNTFAHVLTPTVSPVEVFGADPELVGMLVDFACAGRGISARTVRDELAEAVCGLAETATEGPSGERVYRTGVIEGGQGIGVGDVRQVDETTVAVHIPGAIRRAIDRAPEMVVDFWLRAKPDPGPAEVGHTLHLYFGQEEAEQEEPDPPIRDEPYDLEK